jgi:hypothetical protein
LKRLRGKSSLTSFMPLADRGAIAAPLREMAGVGLLTLIATVAAVLFILMSC